MHIGRPDAGFLQTLTGLRQALNGRALAIAVLTVVSASSFALGFFVGKEATRYRTETGAVKERAALPGLEAPRKEPAPPAQVAVPSQEPRTVGKAVSPRPGTTYSVQVGAYRNREAAEALKARLLTEGFGAFVVESGTSQGTMYKVRVGRFRDRKEADLQALKLGKIAGGEYLVISN